MASHLNMDEGPCCKTAGTSLALGEYGIDFRQLCFVEGNFFPRPVILPVQLIGGP